MPAFSAPVARISVALFLLTFAAYFALGPRETAYDYQLSQANNILHGHLDLVPEYTRNLGVLERVLYDGQGFCLPLDDPRGPGAAAQLKDPRFSAECRTYMQHSLGPSFLLLPLVLLFGAGINQTLASVVVAALTAPLVHAIARRFSDDLTTQLAMTVLVMFGTILWWVGANGGVWFFAHTTAVFFLFGAIYATVVLRNPLLAGALVGAAFLCRPTTILAGFFPFVALSDLWLAPVAGRPAWRAIRWRPLLGLVAGVAPFVLVAMTVNYLRFDNPFESGYSYSEEFHQTHLQALWAHGVLGVSYLGNHVAVVFEQLPVVAARGSYVWPSWAGLAMWVTTPPFLYGLFTHLQTHHRFRLWAAASIVLGSGLMIWRALATGLGWDGIATVGSAPPIHLLPFFAIIVLAVGAAIVARDRLALACWAAILPIAFADGLFAATGWAQFGYRYGLDFTPFLIVLVAGAVGARLRWHHVLLIGLAILVNLWGVLWIYVFEPLHTLGWTWVSF